MCAAPADEPVLATAADRAPRSTQVELVCEGLPFWEPPAAAHVIAVPPEYSCPNGTQGRARAMHYASHHSPAAAGDWIVYLGAASVLRERTARALSACGLQRPPLTRCALWQVDAILAHIVDEAFRLSAARERHDRHASQYGRVAQARQRACCAASANLS